MIEETAGHLLIDLGQPIVTMMTGEIMTTEEGALLVDLIPLLHHETTAVTMIETAETALTIGGDATVMNLCVVVGVAHRADSIYQENAEVVQNANSRTEMTRESPRLIDMDVVTMKIEEVKMVKFVL